MGSKARFGSDLMVDAIKACGFPYVALNPGSSFRGLHDSLVNHGGNVPEMILCQHEKIAVGIAHGYAKATGDPMAVILHDLVGLLHGALGIYYAHVDRVPMVVFGGSGPQDASRRRPNIDWIHTANVQGSAVREYTKWDDQPASVAAVPDAIRRAYEIAVTGPQGPVYVALDAGLQEDELDAAHGIEVHRPRPPSRLAPDPEGLGRLADLLVGSERPVIVAGYAGRDDEAFDALVELAELLPAGVIDTNARLSFPSRHPMNVTGSTVLADADLVLFVDTKDQGKPTQALDSTTRGVTSLIPPGAAIVELGFGDLGLSSWSHDFAHRYPTELSVLADTGVAMPLLVESCRRLVSADDKGRERRNRRRDELAAVHADVIAGWEETVRERWDETPVAPPRLVAEVGEAVSGHDWVLAAGTAHGWALRQWDLDAAYRHPGRSLGTATQIGIALGVALAHRGTGRLVVTIQPDGDLMFDLGALWTAAKYEIPILIVMYNNRAYYNDWEHQIRVAVHRGTPVENAVVGMDIAAPAPDFAAAARALGVAAWGPYEAGDDLAAGLAEATRTVVEEGRPALVDVVTAHR